MSSPLRVAAIQATPAFMNRTATIEKACALITEAGANGARLAVFPEAFVPGYPLWCWHIPPGHTHPLRELYSELVANAVVIGGGDTDRLCDAARGAGVAVAIGINELNAEASGTTVYNTLLYIDETGSVRGHHRKLMPTAGERLIWGMGDGADLDVHELAVGRVSGLICWENYMPLARYALLAQGVDIFIAPTWDRGEPWLSTMRHIAKEGRCFVISCCSPVHMTDIPDRFAFKKAYLGAHEGYVNPGEAVIVDPDGKIVAGPTGAGETILYAEIDPSRVVGPRWQLDVAGHYARPDIFELIVHRRKATYVAFTGELPST